MKKKTFLKILAVGVGVFALFLFFSALKARAEPTETALYIYKGWNIISSPIDKPLNVSELTKYCKLLTFEGKVWTWAYDQESGWTQPTQVGSNEGIYVLSLEDCVAKIEGTPATFSPKTLKSGWNLISITEKSFEEIKGNCEIAPYTGIWRFDSQLQQFDFLLPNDRLERGKAYWVAVKNNCQLSFSPPSSKRPLVVLLLFKDMRVCNVLPISIEGCLSLKLDDHEAFNIRMEVTRALSEISQWTNGAINPRLEIIEIPTRNIEMTRWQLGWYLAPWKIKSFISPFLTEQPDFIIATQDTYDDVQKKAVPMSLCGATFGADNGIDGASYIWVPKTYNPDYLFECATKGTYLHEWLNALDWALKNVSRVENIYGSGYPSCGTGNANGYKWFPNASFDHEKDPDYEACGNLSYCSSKGWDGIRCSLEWSKHILGKHYNPSTNLIGNYCRDGVKDFSETGVDCGEVCKTTCPSSSP